MSLFYCKRRGMSSFAKTPASFFPDVYTDLTYYPPIPYKIRKEQEAFVMPEIKRNRRRVDTRKLFIRIVALLCAVLIAGSILTMVFYM